MCKSEIHSSVHFRRTPEILQRSKGGRYKSKYMKKLITELQMLSNHNFYWFRFFHFLFR